MHGSFHEWTNGPRGNRRITNQRGRRWCRCCGRLDFCYHATERGGTNDAAHCGKCSERLGLPLMRNATI
jgi:hypothetical protein